jgi:predicted dehydrogenase
LLLQNDCEVPKVIRVAVVGLGKMGMSHLALVRAHPAVELVAVCDSSNYILGVLQKYTGVATHSDYEKMLRDVDLDAVVIATPTRMHARMVRSALEKNVHVFCEKPLTLSSADADALVSLGAARGLVTQVGYHNRFVGAFREVKALLDAGALGTVTHALGEAYGPVVTKPKGSTWRSQRAEGGGCLYDYAAHPIDLLNWFLGEPVGVGGTVLNRIFSRETEDEVFSTLYYPEGKTAQISVNWSDESYRKMTTRVTVWGTAGRIFADRQECQVYLRDDASLPPGYEPGWNVRYTTELTEPVWFYLRGEEYSAQVNHFFKRIGEGRLDGLNGFDSAALTDGVIAMMLADAEKGAATRLADGDVAPAPARPSRRLRFRRRVSAPQPAPAGLETGGRS